MKRPKYSASHVVTHECDTGCENNGRQWIVFSSPNEPAITGCVCHGRPSCPNCGRYMIITGQRSHGPIYRCHDCAGEYEVAYPAGLIVPPDAATHPRR